MEDGKGWTGGENGSLGGGRWVLKDIDGSGAIFTQCPEGGDGCGLGFVNVCL